MYVTVLVLGALVPIPCNSVMYREIYEDSFIVVYKLLFLSYLL
jgi:hypothetical protein